jgi:hypothetical protein
MSSLCAAEAAFTRAEFAAAIDFAASKIISSKLRFSSASCQQKHNPHKVHITINSPLAIMYVTNETARGKRKLLTKT